MQLINKKTLYTCIKSGDNIKINGAVQLDSSNRLIAFSGNFNNLDDTYCGDFVYTENDEGTINISTNNILIEKVTEAIIFLINVIREIKQELKDLK